MNSLELINLLAYSKAGYLAAFVCSPFILPSALTAECLSVVMTGESLFFKQDEVTKVEPAAPTIIHRPAPAPIASTTLLEQAPRPSVATVTAAAECSESTDLRSSSSCDSVHVAVAVDESVEENSMNKLSESLSAWGSDDELRSESGASNSQGRKISSSIFDVKSSAMTPSSSSSSSSSSPASQDTSVGSSKVSLADTLKPSTSVVEQQQVTLLTFENLSKLEPECARNAVSPNVVDSLATNTATTTSNSIKPVPTSIDEAPAVVSAPIDIPRKPATITPPTDANLLTPASNATESPSLVKQRKTSTNRKTPTPTVVPAATANELKPVAAAPSPSPPPPSAPPSSIKAPRFDPLASYQFSKAVKDAQNAPALACTTTSSTCAAPAPPSIARRVEPTPPTSSPHSAPSASSATTIIAPAPAPTPELTPPTTPRRKLASTFGGVSRNPPPTTTTKPSTTFATPPSTPTARLLAPFNSIKHASAASNPSPPVASASSTSSTRRFGRQSHSPAKLSAPLPTPPTTPTRNLAPVAAAKPTPPAFAFTPFADLGAPLPPSSAAAPTPTPASTSLPSSASRPIAVGTQDRPVAPLRAIRPLSVARRSGLTSASTLSAPSDPIASSSRATTLTNVPAHEQGLEYSRWAPAGYTAGAPSPKKWVEEQATDDAERDIGFGLAEAFEEALDTVSLEDFHTIKAPGFKRTSGMYYGLSPTGEEDAEEETEPEEMQVEPGAAPEPEIAPQPSATPSTPIVLDLPTQTEALQAVDAAEAAMATPGAIAQAGAENSMSEAIAEVFDDNETQMFDNVAQYYGNTVVSDTQPSSFASSESLREYEGMSFDDCVAASTAGDIIFGNAGEKDLPLPSAFVFDPVISALQTPVTQDFTPPYAYQLPPSYPAFNTSLEHFIPANSSSFGASVVNTPIPVPQHSPSSDLFTKDGYASFEFASFPSFHQNSVGSSPGSPFLHRAEAPATPTAPVASTSTSATLGGMSLEWWDTEEAEAEAEEMKKKAKSNKKAVCRQKRSEGKRGLR